MRPRGDVCFYLLLVITITTVLWTISFMSYCKNAYNDGYSSGVKTSVRYKKLAEEYGW